MLNGSSILMFFLGILTVLVGEAVIGESILFEAQGAVAGIEAGVQTAVSAFGSSLSELIGRLAGVR